MLKTLGWVVWAIAVLLAASWAYGLRAYARAGKHFTTATAVQTLFLWVISIGFLISDYNKLHILWLGPVSFVAAQFIAFVGIPILSPLVLLLTRGFVRVVLTGVGRPTRETN